MVEASGAMTQYFDVVYKKQRGSVTLSSSTLTFQLDTQHQSTSHSPEDVTEEQSLPALSVPLSALVKHQVSPVTYPKSLLKLILAAPLDNKENSTTSSTKKSNGNSLTFQMKGRDELERIRNDITVQLQLLHNSSQSSSNRKRPHSDNIKATAAASMDHTVSFADLDSTAIAVTRASLLSANAALRQQHKHLVMETHTVSEDDFWQTHQHLLQDEYAQISGLARAGTSSVLQSHLPSAGRITLGVEEMRQIFILYPAVHQAYEDKVPLELSDEQFWRKYLESEYFHRDRGRMGSAARNHAPTGSMNKQQQQQNQSDKKKDTGPTMEQQDARAAAVGTDDIFSRYAQKLQESSADSPHGSNNNDNSDGSPRKQWGTQLAVGQFDLASTFESDRGHLLEGPKDTHPPNPHDDDGKGARVIQKYNRHWAMVLHPDEAIAGANLMEVARKSTRDILPTNRDAYVRGGVDEETRRLVDFANASEANANHASGMSLQKDNDDNNDGNYEALTLRNVEAYYAVTSTNGNNNGAKKLSEEDAATRHVAFAKALAAKSLSLVKALDTESTDGSSGHLPSSCFPPAVFGRELLSALTKKMAKDSQTEAESIDMVNKLPEDFRTRLQTYFRRSSELLRHFFGLRRLELLSNNNNDGIDQGNVKLARIVVGMETFYREMEGMRRDLPQTEIGEMMRKMCLPIMDQLDWAFKLHREGNGDGGGGGFVTVEQF